MNEGNNALQISHIILLSHYVIIVASCFTVLAQYFMDPELKSGSSTPL
jgi:hypothetical protein